MKKLTKLTSIILSLLMLAGVIAVAPISANAETLTSGDYEYEVLSDGTARITKYRGSDQTLIIPSALGGKTVTEIGEASFYGRSAIEYVTIPGSVKTIGESAFSSCLLLREVLIEDGVKTIENYAFYKSYYSAEARNVQTTSIPSSVTSIGDKAFGYTEELWDAIKGQRFYIHYDIFGKLRIVKGSYADTWVLAKDLNSELMEHHIGYITEMKACAVSGIKAKTYNGKAQTQSITVKDGEKTLENGKDYTVSYKNNKNAGTATITIKGVWDNYAGSVNKTFKINKAANSMKVTAKKTVTANSKKKTTIKKAVTVSKAQGKVTYKTNNKKVTVKNGTMTVAKGLKKGKTISVKVTATAKGNTNYKSAKKTVTVKIKVK